MSKAMKIQIGTSGEARPCPYCESENVRRSRRQGLFEKSLGRLLFLHPYRCEACDARYFILGARRTRREHRHGNHSSSPQHI